MTQLQVNQFSHGLLNPGLGWLLSCLGSFIGLRCLTRARAYTGRARASGLLIASVAVSGEPSSSLLLPLLLGASVVTFLLMLIIAVSPNEDEIRADASLSRRLRAGGSLDIPRE